MKIITEGDPMKKCTIKKFCELSENMQTKTYKIQNITQTINDALYYCSDNSQGTGHLLDVFEYLLQEIELLLDIEDKLSANLLRIKINP